MTDFEKLIDYLNNPFDSSAACPLCEWKNGTVVKECAFHGSLFYRHSQQMEQRLIDERDEARRRLVDSQSLFDLAEVECDELYEAWEPPEDGQAYYEEHLKDTAGGTEE